MAKLGWREKCDDLHKTELGSLKSQGTHLKIKKKEISFDCYS